MLIVSLTDLVRQTVQDRAEKYGRTWRRDTCKEHKKESEPVIASEEMYPHGDPDAARVQERQPKRMKTAKGTTGEHFTELQWVGDALTAQVGSNTVVLGSGV